MPLLAETDWTVVISAVGGAAVLVIGALGGWYLKILSARAAVENARREAEAKTRRDDEVAARKAKRDETAELYRILDAKERDGQEWREQVHAVRNEWASVNNRLAVCEWDRKRLLTMIEDQGRAIREAGIQVHYRPVPDQPPGEVELHGPEATAE